jgi:hypothetical protein
MSLDSDTVLHSDHITHNGWLVYLLIHAMPHCMLTQGNLARTIFHYSRNVEVRPRCKRMPLTFNIMPLCLIRVRIMVTSTASGNRKQVP